MKDVAELLSRHRPELVDVVHEAGTRLFAPMLRPEFVRALERFLAKSGRNVLRNNRSVGTLQPVQLAAYDDTRIELLIFNAGSATVYFSDSDNVSVGGAGDPEGGFPILSNTGISLPNWSAECWAVSGSAAQDVRVIDIAGG